MSHKINELWKTKEGSKTVWKLQAPKGILTCNTRKEAEAWQKAYWNSLKKKEATYNKIDGIVIDFEEV